MKLAVATALVLVGCRASDDTTTCTPQPHQCLDESCCDPACTGALGSDTGEGSPSTCSTVGYECVLFEAICTCASDHQWSCRDTANIGHDMSIRCCRISLRPLTDPKIV